MPITPQEFVRTWRAVTRKERSAAQEHFSDLCRLVRHPTPAEDDPTGQRFTFEAGVGTLGAVSPVLECVVAQPNGTFVAWFGYRNPNASPVTFAVGMTNRFTLIPTNRSQPTVFQPGRQVRVFSVAFPGTNLVWTLNGRTSTASRNSTRCP